MVGIHANHLCSRKINMHIETLHRASVVYTLICKLLVENQALARETNNKKLHRLSPITRISL